MGFAVELSAILTYESEPYEGGITFYETIFDIRNGTGWKCAKVYVESVKVLPQVMREFGERAGFGCAVSARCLEPRKPRGFKDAAKTQYVNVTLRPKEEATI